MPKSKGILWIYIITIALTSLIIGCSSKTVSETDPVATWGDTMMTVAGLKDKLIMRFRNEATAEKKTLEERLSIMNEYINRELKLAEARELGYEDREKVQKAYRESIERRSGDLLYNQMIRDRLLKEDMLRDFYEHDKFEVRARHLLIATPEDVGDDTMSYWERINEVWKKAQDGENFVNLVDKYSEDSSIDRSLHGDLDYFTWGRMVDSFQEAAWALEPGEISAPVRTKYGYHLIQLIDKRSTGLEVRTSHILVKVSRRSAPAETTAAWEKASMILEEARKKGADFGQLARKYSEDDRTWVNGDVGWLPKGSMPSEYWELAFKMKVDEINGPVRTYKGYHIIKVTEIRDVIKPMEEKRVKDRLYSRLARIHREEINTFSKFFIDSVIVAFDFEFNEDAVTMLLTKLSDASVPTNMNVFSALTREDRDMVLLTDRLGGIKVEDLVERYGDHRFPVEFRNEKEWLEELVKPMRLTVYLNAIAEEVGLHEHPDVLEDGKRAADNAMLPEIEQDMVYKKAAPDEEEIAAYYEDNIDKYTDAATVTAWEVMVDDEQLAKDIITRIGKGENISTLARQFTLRTSIKRKGGKLGPFKIDQYGAVSRKAFEMELDELAGPIKEGNMFSVIKVIEKTPEKVKTLDEARKEIESDIRFRKQKELKTGWVESLRKDYKVKVYKDVVKRIWPLIEPLPETLVAERDKWLEDRKLIAEKAKLRAEEEKIKLKLRPNTEQTFIRDGKEIKVKIGEPRYKDKDGNEVEASKSKVKLTPKGQLKSSEGMELKLAPKKKP